MIFALVVLYFMLCLLSRYFSSSFCTSHVYVADTKKYIYTILFYFQLFIFSTTPRCAYLFYSSYFEFFPDSLAHQYPQCNFCLSLSLFLFLFFAFFPLTLIHTYFYSYISQSFFHIQPISLLSAIPFLYLFSVACIRPSFTTDSYPQISQRPDCS